jgi:FkbM family methyltransferase
MMSITIWKDLAKLAGAESAVLDIGAYRGEFSVAARAVNPTTRIFAFEPNPASLVELKSIAELHGVKVVTKAVSDLSGTSSFQCDEQRSSLSSASSGDIVEVQTVSLDDWVKTERANPFLIKVDVEDAAAKVINGAYSTLRTSRPIILCEVLSEKVGSAIENQLPNEYCAFLINENRGLERKTRITRYDWRFKNWLFIPDNLVDLVSARVL